METEFSIQYSLPPYPPGIRFNPTDVELIQYLYLRICGRKLPCEFIKEENVYACNPEELIEKYKEDFEDNWYFFTPRNRKYSGGSRPSRSAGDGCWKATGSDKDILNKKGRKIGVKKSLTFVLGEYPRGIKTNFLMNEYRIDEFQRPVDAETKSTLLDTWVLCEIHYGRSGSKGATSSRNATNTNEADNIIEDSLLMSAEANQPDETTDNAPALAEVVAVEPTNNICQDQFNASVFAIQSEADQADGTTNNPLASPEVRVAEPINNNFQDQFNPLTLRNLSDSQWDFFLSTEAPSCDIFNDFSFTDQVRGYSFDQSPPFSSEFSDFDWPWSYLNTEIDDNAKLQESSLDEANTRVQQSVNIQEQQGLCNSTVDTQEQQGLCNSTVDTQEQQGLGNSTVDTQEQQSSGNSDEKSTVLDQHETH